MAAQSDLIALLLQARDALAEPDNDFSWSSWQDATAAVEELDGHIAGLRRGGTDVDPLDLQVLFAATGPICEVSRASGWSEAYRGLAQRFDAALERFVSAGS
jgi:hypothetical protein